MTFLLVLVNQSTYEPEKHSFAYRPLTSEQTRNVAVLFCNTDKVQRTEAFVCIYMYAQLRILKFRDILCGFYIKKTKSAYRP